jgi:hypothetical protein
MVLFFPIEENHALTPQSIFEADSAQSSDRFGDSVGRGAVERSRLVFERIPSVTNWPIVQKFSSAPKNVHHPARK